tara:strand:+ start:2218 stop:3135 length:918 start_codon:yes stop_codon:yes gene_type:complete
MVKFFNQKEDVIDLQLTPYGKSKFSQGLFNPFYYGFYDNGIIYDSGYAGIYGEIQNNIVTRIKEQTPRLRVQANFTSSMSEENIVDIKEYQFDNVTEANSHFFRFLGRNSPWSDYAPSWLINTMEDSNGFVDNYSFRSNLAIPVFTASLGIEYEKIETPYMDNEGEEQTYIEFSLHKNERLLLDVLELNTVFKGNANYEIEVFRRMPGQEDNLVPLRFLTDGSYSSQRQQDARQAGIEDQIGGTDPAIGEAFPDLTPEYVNYFLSVNIDSEIDERLAQKGSLLYRSDYEAQIVRLCEQAGIEFED